MIRTFHINTSLKEGFKVANNIESEENITLELRVESTQSVENLQNVIKKHKLGGEFVERDFNLNLVSCMIQGCTQLLGDPKLMESIDKTPVCTPGTRIESSTEFFSYLSQFADEVVYIAEILIDPSTREEMKIVYREI